MSIYDCNINVSSLPVTTRRNVHKAIMNAVDQVGELYGASNIHSSNYEDDNYRLSFYCDEPYNYMIGIISAIETTLGLESNSQ